MSQIRITPETMRQRAASYHQQSETIQQVISTMDKLLRTLQDEWEGAASRAYVTEYNRLRPGFVQAQDMAQTISDNLNKIANATERQDQEIAGQLFAGMKSETQPVFPEMAKLIFSGVTLHMARTAGGRDLKTSDLTGFLKRATGEDLIRVFSHPSMQDYRSCISFIKGNNAQTQGVLSYVVSCVQKVFGTASAGRRQFSIREMYQKPGRTVLFLEYDIAKAISTAPLYGVIADRVIAEALGGRAEKRSNVYLFVDELSALPPIERLSKALSFGRGLNVHVLAGVQNTPAIEAIYGKYGALGLLAGFQNIFTFKLNDNETIQYISDRLGETYEDVSYRNLRQNIHAQRTGKTLAVHDFDVINRTLGLCAVALEGEKPFLFHMPKYQGG